MRNHTRHSDSKRGRPCSSRPARQQPAAIALLLSAFALALAGCGESSGPTSSNTGGATATATSTTTAARATTASRSPTTTSAAVTPNRGAGAGGHTAKVRRRHAHIVLPAPNGPPEPKISAAERAVLPVTDIYLASSGIAHTASSSASTIASRYTCRGADESPPLQWRGVPNGTQELALFVIATQPVDGKLAFPWAVARISPTFTGMQAGQVPSGAVVGRGSSGQARYSLCPTGGRETYVFILFALPKSLSPQSGFEPAALRMQAKAIARHTGLLVGSYG